MGVLQVDVVRMRSLERPGNPQTMLGKWVAKGKPPYEQSPSPEFFAWQVHVCRTMLRTRLIRERSAALGS